ncbi:hypothetical protein A2382_00035 [Candidatus Woesebacteria bacterium RIFOXYB1_FULL_38_16]|uniref:Uncharacterized protein n=1 Tax=Candidatus Woesebacteria bacterium RIFOXYB1_FULL_38_16 TaxID=1802538 RepID=A0A1F8CT60_9BACT|nr:MAG: hypothetical protein A2191_01550 [Candidatus Woesebacteria bacterium RIFOXYA1_FULL_38_9]OGM79533.1 MAG: hypothetical protein A2382_00035 [Candidatus Woesebacteria bacterium RIFOXYB1_FULL_38_16]
MKDQKKTRKNRIALFVSYMICVGIALLLGDKNTKEMISFVVLMTVYFIVLSRHQDNLTLLIILFILLLVLTLAGQTWFTTKVVLTVALVLYELFSFAKNTLDAFKKA